MNILIADSGSTKTEWSLVTNDDQRTGRYTSGGQRSGRQTIRDIQPGSIVTEGLNPFYHTVETITGIVKEEVFSKFPGVDRIFFYGAGCTGEEAAAPIKKGLQDVYGDIRVEVHPDLLGAARALFGRKEGIACILGTGSNSCHYDGSRIIDQIPPLGFILGDEGSAGALGRRILQAYFYRELPPELCRWLEQHFDMERSAILDQVYKNPHYNTFVASFAGICEPYKDHSFVKSMLSEEIHTFLERHAGKYRTEPDVPVGFVGSVAWHHQEIIKTALEGKGRKAEKFLRAPMEGLRAFHWETC